MNDKIIIQGARENNLKNVNLTIPRDKLVVFTGLSGSGKSSLAFDTIYAEGQRRYVESLSSYARQFLGQMDKPDVDSIDGLSPAISIDQKTTSKNPRSTVGTVTEIYDYLRLLYARIGIPHCPKCGREIRRQTIDQIVDRVEALGEGTRFIVLSPVIRGKKGEHKKVFEDARKSGFARVRVDGILYDLTEDIPCEKNKKHTIELVVDRLVLKDGLRRRSAQSALFLILDAMAKLFAPILAFTCDEIWQSMPHRASDDARNVLLNQMPEGFAQYVLEDAAMEKWDVVMKLRQDVNGVLEKARADKRIGKALEAHVTLATEDAAIRSACEGVNLAEVCIVSDCVWAQPKEGAEVGTGVNYPNLTIGVSEAKGTKCPRCWKHSTAADENGLCPRCASVIAKCADFGEV